jgi:hypothetical protein
MDLVVVKMQLYMLSYLKLIQLSISLLGSINLYYAIDRELVYSGSQKLDFAYLQFFTFVVVLTLHACAYSCALITYFCIGFWRSLVFCLRSHRGQERF